MPIERVTPSFEEHNVYERPPEDAPLWRYMDVARFIALLERRALFFSSIRGFPDRFEGSLTPELLAEVEAIGPRQVADWRSWPLVTYLNCWNEDTHENVALWSMYTSPSGGVAIKSSSSLIIEALESDTSGLIPADALHIGRVHYLDYSKASIPGNNAFWPLLHKRMAYSFEHEVRLALWPQRLFRAVEPTLTSGQSMVAAAAAIAPPGYDVAIDPDKLIDTVVVAPEAPAWLLDLIARICHRYNLTASVVRSDLDAEPV